jgi:hypothetical protein
MSKKFRLLMVLVLVIGLLGGLMSASTVSADPTPGSVIEIPRIDKGDVFATDTENEWDTVIHVQNVDLALGGGVVAFFWPAWDGTCPSNDPGPCGHACMQLPYNGVWTLHSQIPSCAQSAIIYSIDAANFQDACADAGVWGVDSTEDWKDWVGDYAWNLEAPFLAVTVDRWGSDPYDEYIISSSYTGVADWEMVGPGPPFKYFAPYVMHNYHDLDTTITIMNSGEWCTSCWIYYKKQGNCEQMKAQHIEAIAPGQAIRIGPGVDADMGFPTPEVGADWLGSAYITCNEPMGVIIDQLSNSPAGVVDPPNSLNLGTLLSMRGMPYEDADQTMWYADLLYREISGWDSSIQVQNMTVSSMPTFVTVEFFDKSGDSVFYLGEWVCRNGTATFYLPAIIDLGVNFPFGYEGAAEIESHYQIDYPGGGHGGQPIVAVVDMKKRKLWDDGANEWRHTLPGETQGGAYNAHPLDQKIDAWAWAMPFIAKEQEGVTSRIVIRNNSNCNKISGVVYLKNETGVVEAQIPVNWLHPKHLVSLDLNYFGQVWPGFVGAAEFWVTGLEQLCDVDLDGHADPEPVMPSVVVLNYGWEKELPSGGGAPQPITAKLGDLAAVYEAIPYFYDYSPCNFTVSGNVIDDETLEPLKNVKVWSGDVEYMTDSTGYYELDLSGTAMEGETVKVEAFKEGYTVSYPTDLAYWEYAHMCDDAVKNFEMHIECTVTVTGTVEDKETGLPIADAEVKAETLAGAGTTATTGADGSYEILDVPFDADSPVIVSVSAVGYNGAMDTAYAPECWTKLNISFQLHQTPKSRILLYYGNCGNSPQPEAAPNDSKHEYYNARDVFKYFGYEVDYFNWGDWPTDPDLEEYKVIFLLGPGNECGDEPSTEFTPGQVVQLDLFLRNGGRLVVMSDVSGTTNTGAITVENLLLGALNDLDVRFSDDNGDGLADGIAGALADDLHAAP